MRINNVDVNEYDLTHKVVFLRVPSFIMDVVRPLERNLMHFIDHSVMDPMYHHRSGSVHLPHAPIRKFDGLYHYENVANLLHTIPIYLRDSRPERGEEGGIVDPLGAYYPNRNNDNPYIELYMSNIDSQAGNDNLHFKWLFTTVLIHELAHAAMDIFNHVHCHLTVEKVQYFTPFGKWREESMANAVALRIIRDYGDKKFYDYAKQYMRSQPAEYALGVLMEDFGYLDFRSVVDGKVHGVHQNLQSEWLKYVKENPTSSELKRWNEILFYATIYKYKTRYYTDHQDLVLDIVKDYIQKQGSLSFKHLCDVFPNVKVQSKTAYCPLTAVLNDSQFFTEPGQVLHLSDGDYALYKYWYNDDLNNFLSIAQKQGFTIDMIKNY